MTSSSSSSPEIKGTDSQDRFSYKLATHEEVLDDLSSRFILNLPDEELSSLERICFQVEQAHWFYEDFIREENPKFPSLPLKKFSEMLFQACPLLHQWSHDHELAYTTFMQYKTRVPVCGAIMLNDTWDKCVLVKGWKSSSGWGFPKGKINQVEPPSNCAIREVLEETGYNLAGQLNPDNVIEMSIREQKISLFIVPGVPEDYHFKTRTRKEISKIEWFRLVDLPTWKRNKTAPGRFYLISPFIGPLKAFIIANKPRPQKTPKLKKAPAAISRDVQIHSMPTNTALESSPHPSFTNDTLSTQHSERSSTAVPYVVDNDPVAAPMDPHFASLLSALAISASAIDKQQAHDTSKLSVVGEQILKDGICDSQHEDPSVTAVDPQEAPTTSTSISLAEPPPPPALPQPSQIPQVSPSLDEIPGFTLTETSQSMLSPISPPAMLPHVSPPSRPLDGGITKQHIALLDAVSKESARLQEAYRTAAANGIPANVNDNFKYPVLAASAPPPTNTPQMYSQSNAIEDPAINGSVPHYTIPYRGALPSAYELLALQGVSGHSMGLTSVHPPPLQTRPRTSFSYHRGPSNSSYAGSASMNQNQLLSLINGSYVTPPSALSNGYPFPYSTGRNHPYLSFHPPPHTGLRSPYHMQQLAPPAAVPLPSLPTSVSHLSVGKNNALLSILNDGRGGSESSDLTPYPPAPSSGFNTIS